MNAKYRRREGFFAVANTYESDPKWGRTNDTIFYKRSLRSTSMLFGVGRVNDFEYEVNFKWGRVVTRCFPDINLTFK